MPSSFDPHHLPRDQFAANGIEDVGVERLYSGWCSFDRLHVRQLFKGQPVEVIREIHDHGHAVAVLVYDPQARFVVLVRQIRWGSLVSGGPARLLEAPAGLRNAGEPPGTTAAREVREETGFNLKALHPVGAVYTSPGAVTERLHLFLGEVDSGEPHGEGGGLADEHEDIEIVRLGYDELFALQDNFAIEDMKTLLLVSELRRRAG